MDIDWKVMRQQFDDWFKRECFADFLYEPMWRAYVQGVIDSPQLPQDVVADM